jgi:DNA-binding transcriptional LysR family regulator
MSYAQPHKRQRAPRPNLLWDDFRIVIVVAEARSFNLAAKRLGTNQATISRRIDRVEAAIRLKLFTRSARGTELTPEGQRFFDEASSAKVAFSRALERARGREGSDGEVKIAVTEALATYWLTRHLDWFQTHFPRILLRVNAFDRIIEDKTDLFDCQLQLFDPSGVVPVATRLATLHYIPYASQRYVEERGAPKNIDELAAHKLIDLTHYMLDKGNWVMMTGNESICDSFSIVTTSSPALVETVRQGRGISLLPTYLGSIFPDLVPCDIGLRFSVAAWLVYRRERASAWPASAAIDFMRHAFDKRTMPWFADDYVPPQEFAGINAGLPALA